MAEQQSLMKNILKKGITGVIVGVILVGVSIPLHFPLVFQAMFFFYALLGAAVFIVLDAPAVKPISGGKAVVALLAFYVVLSGVYIGGASLWPQYDPEVEKGKIEKLLSRRKAAIMKRLEKAGVGAVAAVPGAKPPSARPKAAAGDLVALGLEQWNLQECYNCHVITGKGETSKKKKRGPNLDNIGNIMTAEQLREKILYPKSWKAEGYDKQYKKGKMPDKYNDLMFDDEVDALVVFLTTLKDTSANTPKAIKMK